MFNDIIVPLDGSQDAGRALGPACALAGYLDVEVRAVSFAVDDDDRLELTTAVEDQMRGYGGVLRSLLVEPLLSSVADQLGDVLVESPGSLACMSTTGRGRAAALLGSVASGVLSRVEGPVLLVGPGHQATSFRCDGPLVVAVDGSEHAKAMLPIAEGFAGAFDYELEIVTVRPPRETAALGHRTGERRDNDDPATAEEIGDLADAAGGRLGTKVGHWVLSDRDPAKAIVAFAGEVKASLIAMSTQNPVGIRRALLGSTTSTVVSRATCPVLAIHPVLMPT